MAEKKAIQQFFITFVSIYVAFISSREIGNVNFSLRIGVLEVKGLDSILMTFSLKEFPFGYLQGVQSRNFIDLQCMNK